MLSLAACGHHGSSSPLPPIPSKLFAADSGNHAIVSFINSNPSGPGAVPANRLITGADTGFATSNIPAMALDVGRDLLYVSNELGVLVFTGASSVSGNVVPARTLATLVSGNFHSLYVDSASDRLYVGEISGVEVFDNASVASMVAPNRTLTGDFGPGFSIRGVAVDVGHDILYVAVTTTAPSTSILAFNGASAINGSRPPDRTIDLPTSSDISILLDATSDRLYVSDPGGNISVLDNASAQNGPPAAPRTIPLGGGAGQTTLALDSINDRLYAAAHSSLIIVPGASTVNGSLPAGTYQLVAPTNGDVTAAAVTP